MNFDVQIPLLEQNREKPSAETVLELFKVQLQSGSPLVEPEPLSPVTPDAFEVFEEVSVSEVIPGSAETPENDDVDPFRHEFQDRTDEVAPSPAFDADQLAANLDFGSADESMSFDDAQTLRDVATQPADTSETDAFGFDGDDASASNEDDTAEPMFSLGDTAETAPADDAFAAFQSDEATPGDDTNDDFAADTFAPTTEFQLDLGGDADAQQPVDAFGATDEFEQREVTDALSAYAQDSDDGSGGLSLASTQAEATTTDTAPLEDAFAGAAGDLPTGEQEEEGIYVMGSQDGYGREGIAPVDLQHQARSNTPRPTIGYNADEFWQSVEQGVQQDASQLGSDALEATTMMRAYVPEDESPTTSMEDGRVLSANNPAADADTLDVDPSQPLIDPVSPSDAGAAVDDATYGVQSANKGEGEEKKKKKGFFSMFRKKK